MTEESQFKTPLTNQAFYWLVAEKFHKMHVSLEVTRIIGEVRFILDQRPGTESLLSDFELLTILEKLVSGNIDAKASFVYGGIIRKLFSPISSEI